MPVSRTALIRKLAAPRQQGNALQPGGERIHLLHCSPGLRQASGRHWVPQIIQGNTPFSFPLHLLSAFLAIIRFGSSWEEISAFPARLRCEQASLFHNRVSWLLLFQQSQSITHKWLKNNSALVFLTYFIIRAFFSTIRFVNCFQAQL